MTIVGLRYPKRFRCVSTIWERDSLDWKGNDASDIYSRVTGNVVPGSIILFHNAAEHTPEALADIIEYLLSQGYEIVPVSELLLSGDYEIDHAGMMIKPGKT